MGPKDYEELSYLKVEVMQRFTEVDLDHHVRELKAAEASEINDAGIYSQVEYIYNRAGADWIREVLLEEKK